MNKVIKYSFFIFLNSISIFCSNKKKKNQDIDNFVQKYTENHQSGDDDSLNSSIIEDEKEKQKIKKNRSNTKNQNSKKLPQDKSTTTTENNPINQPPFIDINHNSPEVREDEGSYNKYHESTDTNSRLEEGQYDDSFTTFINQEEYYEEPEYIHREETVQERFSSNIYYIYMTTNIIVKSIIEKIDKTDDQLKEYANIIIKLYEVFYLDENQSNIEGINTIVDYLYRYRDKSLLPEEEFILYFQNLISFQEYIKEKNPERILSIARKKSIKFRKFEIFQEEFLRKELEFFEISKFLVENLTRLAVDNHKMTLKIHKLYSLFSQLRYKSFINHVGVLLLDLEIDTNINIDIDIQMELEKNYQDLEKLRNVAPEYLH